MWRVGRLGSDGGWHMIPEYEERSAMTVTEAALAAGVNRRSLRRRLEGGVFPNAYRDAGTQGPASGPWRIPVGDLLDAGLTLDEPQEPDRDTRTPPERSEVERLRSALDESRRRVVEAETLAARRQQVIEAHERELLSLRSALDGRAADEDGDGEGDGDGDGESRGEVNGSHADARAADDDHSDDSAADISEGDAVEPDPAGAPRASTNPLIAPGAPSRPTPPWVPVPVPAPRRRWWQRSR
jgi:hypothetical protein